MPRVSRTFDSRRSIDMIQPPHEALTTAVVIRRDSADDAHALERLAGRDSKPLPAEDLLVAEIEGELRAAVALRSGETISDPFHQTSEVVRLLELRRRQLDGRSAQEPPRGRLRRLVPALARVGQSRR
jgi:hypothetical protein